MTLAEDEFPVAMPGKPLWLITLADLALLLVGFFVLLQANQHLDKVALASGFRAGFGGGAATGAARADPMPVAAVAMMNFTPGSAMLPAAPDGVVAWAREATRDPRVSLKVTGAVDGNIADVDPATGSGTLLAADRARAVAAALAAAGVAPDRLTIVNAARPGARQVVVTLAFAGDTEKP